MKQPISIIQKIYDSEINIRISWSWDAGFYWFIINPNRASRQNADMLLPENPLNEDISNIIEVDWLKKGSKETFSEMVVDLAENIVLLYPDSNFSGWYKEQNEKKINPDI